MALSNVTQQNFSSAVLSNPKPVLVDFWAPWCGPCRMVAPFVEQVAQDFEGRADVAKINVDECPEIARQYGVQSIPTLMVFKAGQVAEKKVGATNKAALAQMLEKTL